jgi:MFS family permease
VTGPERIPARSGAPRRRPDPATCLYAARALRDFGDGFVAVLLAVFLTELGFSPFEVGVVSTVALLGSSLTTLAIGLLGRADAQRGLLLSASALMVLTGIAFAGASGFGWLLLVAFVGTINPSAGNVSIFVPMENALLAGSAPANRRTRLFAAYGLTGAIAASIGSLAAGSPELLVELGVARIDALRAMFILYAILGAAGGLCYRLIPAETASAPASHSLALGPSRRLVLRLAALFSIDAFAGGLIVQSLLALWLFERFDMSLAAAGGFFFASGLLAALSYPVAAWLAGRIGLLNTMVYTHISSSLFLIGAALVPDLGIALALLIARAALSQMDVPTRSSYIMAVVTPAERAAAASVTSVPRGLASAASPALAGALLAAGYLAWPLVICGLLKIVYDLLLLWTFRGVKPPEETASR